MSLKNDLFLLISIVFFSFQCKKSLESVESKYPSGKLYIKYSVDQDKKKQGQWIEFYENGQIKAQVEFNKDLEQGKAVYFYETGELKEVQFFEKGKKNGPDTVFSQNGLIRNISNFQNGLKHGTFIKFKTGNDSVDIESHYILDSLVSFEKH